MLTEIPGPFLADLQGAACYAAVMWPTVAAHTRETGLRFESQLCDYQLFLSSLLFLPTLPFPLYTSLMHTHTRTHSHTHTHSCVPGP